LIRALANSLSSLPSQEESVKHATDDTTVVVRATPQSTVVPVPNSLLKSLVLLTLCCILGSITYLCLTILGHIDQTFSYFDTLLAILSAFGLFLLLLLAATFLIKANVVQINEGTQGNASFWMFCWLLFDYLWALVSSILLPLLSGTPWLASVYRAFGARIGNRIQIEKPCAHVPELLTIGANSYISSDVTIQCVKEHPN